MAAKKCLICSSAFVGRADAKTCSPRCRKRLQQVRFTLSGRSSSRFSKAVVLAVLGLFGFLSILMGSVPHKAVAANTASTMNFQARLLTPAGGVVPDGLYNIRFKIYDGGTQGGASGTGQTNSGTGGTYLWSESYYDTNGVTAGNDFRVNVINGYFSVNLGSQTALSGINWDQELWMTMDIGGTTQTATPTYDGEMTNSNARIKLTGVPYAFSAGQIAKTSGSNRGTLSFNTVANNPNITLPDETGTVCTTAATGVCTVAGTGFVQLQSATPGTQQTGSFNISGTGIAGTLQTSTLQSAAAAALTISGHASSIWSLDAGNLTIDTTGSGASLNFGNGAQNKTIQIGQSGNNAVTQTINIGNGGTGSTTNITIGNSVGGTTTIQGAGGITLGNNTSIAANKSFTANGSALFQDATNSTTAFQVQNSAGAQLINIDNTNPITDITNNANNNLVTNGSFENNSDTGWSTMGASTTKTPDNNTPYLGSYSEKVITSASDASATDGIKYNLTTSTFVSNTKYRISMYLRTQNGTIASNIQIGSNMGSGGDIACLDNQTIISTGWINFSCIGTLGTTSGTPYIYVKINNQAAQTFFVDAVTLTRVSLLSNASVEQALTASDWQKKTGSETSVTQVSTQHQDGSNSLQVVTTGSAQGTSHNITLNDSTQYNLIFYAQANGSNFSTLEAGYNNGTSNTICITAQTVVTTGFSALFCSFVTPSSHTGTPYLYVDQTDSTGRTFYLDNFQLSIGTPTANYREGQVALNGIINSPVILQSQSNSTTAFLVEDYLGSTYIQADTSAAKLYIGNTGTGITIQIGNSTGAVTQTINIGNNATASSTTNINIGSTATAGTIAIGNSGTTTTIVGGNSSSINIGTGTIASGAHTITSASATALAVGPNGTTNPALTVDASTASSATGLKIKSAAAAGGLAISTTSSGTDEALTISAKGAGTLTLASGSTGDVQFFSASNKITSAGALTLASTITANTTNTINGISINTGAISGGSTYSGSGNINTTGGAIQTNSVTRISNTGVGSFITGTTIGTQTFTTNNIADSGALTIASGAASDLILNSQSGTLKTGTNTSAILFTNSGSASVDAASTQALNLGTANNGHTTTLGSTNASALTTIQGGNGITLANNTTLSANSNLSFTTGTGVFDAHLATGTFDTSTGANSLNGNATVTGTNTFTVNGGLATLQAGLTVTGTSTFNSNGAAAFVINNSGSSKAVVTVDTNGNQLVLGTSGASGITGALKFNYANQTGSVTLDASNPSSTAYSIHLPNANGTVCLQSSASCGFILGSGTAFVQNGNSFGATAALGTTDSNSLTFITNSVTQATIAVGGATTFKNSANSTAAFQVQDSASASYFNVNTSDGYVINNGAAAIGNEVENPSFEAGAGVSSDSTGWYTPAAGQAITVSAANARTGNNELQVTGNSSTHALYTKYFAVHPGDTIYTEAYVKNSGGANGDAGIYVEFTDKDKGNATYSNADTGLPGTSYVAKTISTTVPSGKTFVRVAASVKATSTTGTFYFDDFYLKKVNEQAPLLITNVSATAFQVQNSTGITVLGVDSTNSKIFSTIADGGSAIGFTLNTPSYTTSGAKLFSLQNNSAEKFYIDKDGKIVNQGAIQAGGNISTGAGGQFQINGTQISSADLSNNSDLAKLSGTGPQTFTGDNKFTGTVLSQLGSATAFQVQNASNNEVFTVDSNNNQIILGKASTLTGTIKFFGTGGNGYLTLVGPTTPDTGNYTLTIPTITANDTICTNGTRAASCTNYAPSSGSSNYIQNQNALQQTASNFWISGTGRADTSFTTPSVDSTGAAGTIALGNSNATTINIGSASTATTTIGGGNVAHTIHIADAGTSTTQDITIGSAGTNNGSLLFQIGTGTMQFQGQNGSTIAIANNSNNQTVQIGNTTGATALNLNTGTGNFSLDGVSNSTYTLGASTTTGTFTVGGVNQTGAITIGQYNNTGSSIINIGAALASAGTQTVNIATGTTGTGNVLIGNTGGGSTTIQSSGGLVLSGATTDITSGTNEDLTLLANGAGIINLNDSITAGGTLTFSAVGTDITTGTNEDLTLTANGSGNVIVSGDANTGLVFSGSTTDVTTGTNEDLTISPNGSGKVVISADNDTNLQVNGSVADTGYLSHIGLSLTNDANADTVSGLDISATSASTGDADVLYGININNLSSADATVTETALNIGSSWDNAISINGLAVFSGAGVLSTSTSVVAGSYTGITGTGALNAGSITSGFGSIDVGSSDTIKANTFDASTGTTLSIGNGTATGLDLCNTAPCVAVNIGGASTATTTIGGGNAAHTINIGAGATNTNQGITIGSGSTNAGNLLIQVGTGALQLQGQNNSSISIANNSNNQTVTIGNTTGATALNLYTGTGNFILDGVAGTTYTLGASTTTGTFTVGGASQTGALTFGQYNGSSSSTINIGAALASAGTQAVNIGTGTTGTGNITIGNTGGGTTLIHSPTITATGTTINLNAATIATNQSTVALLQAATALNVGSTTGTFTIRNGSLTIGTSAGSGVLINNGSTSNTTLALGDLAAGSIGAAASTVDIYTSFSISPTVGSRTYTIPSPTDGAAGRIIYISNINATNTFTIGSTVFNTHSTGTLVYDGTSWNFAGMDGGSNNYIQNQNSADQTTANFRISGTGRANTRFTSPFFDSITGALGIGDTAATAITIGNTTNTTSIALQGAAAATYDIGTSTTTGTITVGKYNATGTSTINIGAALVSAGTQNINLGTGGGGTNTIIIGSSNAGATTISSPTANINSATIATNQSTIGIFNTNATTATVLQAATSISIGSTTAGGTLTIRNPNQTFGNAAGSGVFTNNGATLNSTLAVLDDSNGGALGGTPGTPLTAAQSVDIYSSISIFQTTAGQTITLPTPTASTSYGRILYLSNIGTTSFILSGINIPQNSTATMVWSNTNGAASWQFAGAGGASIENQSSSDQSADFRVSGTGRANTRFTSPFFDSITGALGIGDTTATAINVGNTSNTTTITLKTSSSGSIVVGNSAGYGALTNNGATLNTTLVVNDDSDGGTLGGTPSGGLTAAQSVDIYTSISINQTTASQTITLPTPTASTSYGRILYISNVGTQAFIIGSVTIGPGQSGTLIWSNTNGAASWQYAGAGADSISNQSTTDQTASFRISGTGRANTKFTSPSFDSITGALGIGDTTATAINVGNTANTATITLKTSSGGSIVLGNSAGFGTTTNNGSILHTTLALGDMAAGSLGSAATTVDIYTSFSIAPTASGRAYTVATPTASTSYGREIFVSNIASAGNYFTISGIRIPPGSTGTLIWSNSNGAASWQFAGAGGASIENQNSADQTATFRIAGTGTINVSSTTALQVQNGSATPILTVNTSGLIVQVGSSASNNGTSIFALNNNDGTTTPTEVDGGMYYNNATSQFLCGENGFWVSCGVPPKDHSYDQYDEFMNGMGNAGIPTSVCTSPCQVLPTNTVGIGGLNWYNSLIGAPPSILGYYYNQTGGNAPTADANRPGILDIQQTGTGNNTGQTMSLGVASMKLGTSLIDLKTAVNITGGNLTALIGIHNETTATTAPTTGVYWKEAANGAWNYCYVNGSNTETCTSSGTNATAGTWYRLEIQVVSSSQVDFYLNGTKFSLTGITYNTTNKVAPAYTSYKTSGTPGTLDVYVDYFELLGTTTATR